MPAKIDQRKPGSDAVAAGGGGLFPPFCPVSTAVPPVEGVASTNPSPVTARGTVAVAPAVCVADACAVLVAPAVAAVAAADVEVVVETSNEELDEGSGDIGAVTPASKR